MSDLTPEMLAELRRLLEAGPLRPWRAGTVDGVDYGSVWGAVARRDDGLFTSPMIVDDVSMWPGAAELIAAAINALPALLDAAAERDALAAKLDAVRALHHREVRWGNEDYSIDAEEYADRKTENDEVDAGWGLDALAAFDVCAECYRVEQSIEQRDGVAVLEGLWPCPTARALDATQAGGES